MFGTVPRMWACSRRRWFVLCGSACTQKFKLCLGLVGSRLLAERTRDHQPDLRCGPGGPSQETARVKIVILDCYVAGQAVHGPHTLAGHAADVLALTGGRVYALAATGDYTTAWFEDDRDTPTPQTYFTKYSSTSSSGASPGEPTV